MQVLPRETWIRAGHQIIWHGRRVCFARKPNCAGCTVAPFCPRAGLKAEALTTLLSLKYTSS